MTQEPRNRDDPKPWIMGPPESDHPIMSELARFFVKFASLELSLILLFAFALRRPRDVAEAILYPIRSIGDRIQIIDTVAEASSDLPENDRKIVQLACQKASELNRRRNLYAHGVYEHRNDKIRVTPYGFASNRKQPEVLKQSRVKTDVGAIDLLFFLALRIGGHIPDDLIAKIEAQLE